MKRRFSNITMYRIIKGLINYTYRSPIKYFRRIFKNLFGIKPIHVSGKKIHRPFFAGLAINRHISEPKPFVRQMLERLSLNSNMTVVDIGANIGQTLLSIKSFYPESKYIGLEPNPACTYYLESLIRLNSLSNCIIIPVGCSEKTKILPLWINRKNLTSGAASLNPLINDTVNKRATYVPLFSLDDVISAIPQNIVNKNSISLLKIDVEGHEPEVLIGATDVLKESRPLIMIEVLPPRSNDDIERLKVIREMQEIVKAKNYNIFQIAYNFDYILEGFTPLASFPNKKQNKTDIGYSRDYLLVPGELSSNIERLLHYSS